MLDTDLENVLVLARVPRISSSPLLREPVKALEPLNCFVTIRSYRCAYATMPVSLC